VTVETWVALVGAAALACVLAAAVRNRAQGTAAGRRFLRYPAAVPGVFVLAFVVTVAVAAPLVAPLDPYWAPHVAGVANLPPSMHRLLGTDPSGRDVYSRLVYGARISLGIGAVAMVLAVTLGAAVGVLAGYFRRGVDAVLMRLVDLGLAMPRIFLLLMIVALWGQLSLVKLVALIGLTGWFATSRVVRAEVLSLREREFIAAARALGTSPARIVWRHVVPNAAAPIIVSAALGIGQVMLLEASLSFVGIGVPSPQPSWGSMIAEGAPVLATAPWTSTFPGLAIAVVVMALNAVGDALRDALDPRKASA
jgi:peptide/nickel transport system permease protein